MGSTIPDSGDTYAPDGYQDVKLHGPVATTPGRACSCPNTFTPSAIWPSRPIVRRSGTDDGRGSWTPGDRLEIALEFNQSAHHCTPMMCRWRLVWVRLGLTSNSKR